MALIKNLFIDQGTSFASTIDVTKQIDGLALDLTNSKIFSQIRKCSESTRTAAEFHCTYIAATNKIILYLHAEETAAIFPSRYEYDVVVKDSNRNSTIRLIEGTVTVNSGATKINV